MMSLSLRRTLLGSGYIWRQTAGEIYSALNTMHCHFPGNIQTKLPDAEFVVFGTKWKDNECPVNSIHCICSHIRDCMPHVMTSWPWVGPGSASSPDLVLTFHRSIQIFSGRKRKSEMFHEIFETLSSQARSLQRNSKNYITFYIFSLTLG